MGPSRLLSLPSPTLVVSRVPCKSSMATTPHCICLTLLFGIRDAEAHQDSVSWLNLLMLISIPCKISMRATERSEHSTGPSTTHTSR